jgi:uncharacterized protein YbaP (TraB family)
MHGTRCGPLAAVLLVLAAAAHSVAASGLIYRVTGDGIAPSYLVGTMHSEDPRVTALLSQFAPLIGEVDVVAIEIVPDAVTMLAIGAATLLPLDQSLRGLIGAERFRALQAAARQRDIPTELLDRLKPWAAAVTLGMPGSDSGRFLDMEIYLEALRQQRRVVGLESAAEQLRVFDDMTPQLQILLLEDIIKNAYRLPKQLETLTSAYLEGDLQALDRVVRAQYADMPPEITQWFDQALLERRNIRMLERLADLLERQPVLVAVGALHLGGDSGLVAGLRDRGYRVERWRD